MLRVVLPRTIGDLTDDELSVLHLAQDMDRAGVYPSGDRLNDDPSLENLSEATVRAIRRDLVRDGLLAPVTPDDRPDRVEPDPNDEDEHRDPTSALAPPTNNDGRSAARGPRADTESRAFNLAIFHLLEGKGSQVACIATLTGLSENAVKKRAQRVRETYDEADDPDAGRLSPVEQRYYAKLYKNHTDPAVRQWAMDCAAPRRRRPDCRSARDRATGNAA